MATYIKTPSLVLLATQSVAASSVAVGTAVDVSTRMGGLAYVRFGRRNATAAGAGANIRLEASFAASGDNTWFPFAIFTTAFAAGNSIAVNGTLNAGTNVIPVTNTTGFAAGSLIYIDNSTIGNSEWGRVKSIVANTSMTIEDNLVNAQTGSTVYNSAEIYSPVAIPEGAIRIRAVDDGSVFTQAHAIQVLYTTIDGIS